MPLHPQGHRVPEATKQLWLCYTTSMRDALVNSEYHRAETLGDSQVGQQGQERSRPEEDHE